MNTRSFARAGALAAGLLIALPGAAWSQQVKSSRAGTQDATPQAEATPVSGNCIAPKTTYRAMDSVNTFTSSTAFVPIPQMGVAFKQGGTAAGCIIVHFAAEVIAPLNEVIFVRARLDGTTTAAPTDVQLSGDDDEDGDSRWARSHAAIFVFPNVAPGTRTVRLEWRTFSGREVTMHHRTMVVQHP